MPSPESATRDARRIGDDFGEARACGKVAVHGAHQFGHGRAQMAAGYVGVQVEPQAFDPILVGAVRRQKVLPQARTGGAAGGDVVGRIVALIVRHGQPRAPGRLGWSIL